MPQDRILCTHLASLHVHRAQNILRLGYPPCWWQIALICGGA